MNVKLKKLQAVGLAANCYSLLHLLRERLLQKNQNRMILLLIHLTIADLCVILVSAPGHYNQLWSPYFREQKAPHNT